MPSKIRSSVDKSASSFGFFAIKSWVRFKARSAELEGQCKAAVRSLLEKAAERQGGADDPPPVRGEKIVWRAWKRRSEMEGNDDTDELEVAMVLLLFFSLVYLVLLLFVEWTFVVCAVR